MIEKFDFHKFEQKRFQEIMSFPTYLIHSKIMKSKEIHIKDLSSFNLFCKFIKQKYFKNYLKIK